MSEGGLYPEAVEDALMHEQLLADLGLLDPDQPTPAVTWVHRRSLLQRLGAEFTPQERMAVRLRLGIGEPETRQ